jgi:hypothetical protein
VKGIACRRAEARRAKLEPPAAAEQLHAPHDADQPRPGDIAPLSAAEPMRFKIACSGCGCRYAVIGSAFFCPACGHNDADRMFHQSLARIRKRMDVLEELRSAPPGRRRTVSERIKKYRATRRKSKA